MTYTAQLEKLCDLVSSYPPPFIFTHTPFGTLPTVSDHLLHTFRNSTSTLVVSFDAIECFSPKNLYTTIINSLSRHNPEWDVRSASGGGCWEGNSSEKWNTTWDTFVEAFSGVCAERLSPLDPDERNNASIICIAENAERLQANLPSHVIPLTRLHELVSFGTLST